jgi:formylglycine-generating enzyme required for sulfatase activity
MTTNAEYELLEEIGRGPSATVYRAHDMALKRDVAIKELLPHLRSDPRSTRRLLDGARFLAGLSHDNVVPVYGLDEGRGWIIMELMRGGLDSRLAAGPLESDLARSVLRQALQGLEFLHRQGKLHGDIKPANLLINAEGRVKLSDAAGLDGQGEVRKPGDDAKYLAPELINPIFGAVGPAADLYSLGLTALELLEGPGLDAVFQGAGVADPQMHWLRLHGSAEPIPSVRELVPGAPADLARVIDRLLAKKVSERYASAADAVQELKEGELLPVNVAATAPAPSAPAVRGARPAAQVTPLAGSPLPPRQASPAAAAAHKAAPAATSPRSAAGGAKRWSKEWINQQLSDRRVLYPLLGVIIVVALVIFFWPEEEEPRGRVRIKSDPPGATVIIDGRTAKQKTEMKLKLPPGKHRLRLELAGHEPKEQEFTVEANGPVLDINENLRAEVAQATTPPAQPKPAPPMNPEKKETSPPREPPPPSRPAPRLVRFATKPRGADVFVDRQYRGTTDAEIELAPGEHRVRLDKEGYEPLEETLAVNDETPRDFFRELKAVVRSSPKSVLNSIGMQMLLIPAGPFLMGSADSEGKENERPRHEVTLSCPFYMGIHEVTQEQYEKVMGKNPAVFTRGRGGGPRNPVENVSWDDAVAFCRKLSDLPEEKRAGRTYQLPTEAEWEYACRAGKETPEDALAEYAWYRSNSGEGTHPVGQKKPNAWGLYDMQGNVWEWCQDWYSPRYYDETPRRDPRGPEVGSERVIRGGSYQDLGPDCRPARRFKSAPELLNVATGFRVVMVPAAGKESETRDGEQDHRPRPPAIPPAPVPPRAQSPDPMPSGKVPERENAEAGGPTVVFSSDKGLKVSFENGRVVARNKGGLTLWSRVFRNETQLASVPLLFGPRDMLYLATEKTVCCLDGRTGQILWKNTYSQGEGGDAPHLSFDAENQQVVVVRNGTTTRFSSRDGKRRE